MLARGLAFYSRPGGFLASALLCHVLLWWTPWSNQPGGERVYSILQVKAPSWREVKEGIHSRSWRAETTEGLCSPRLAPLLIQLPLLSVQDLMDSTAHSGLSLLTSSTNQDLPTINLMEVSPQLRAPLPSCVKLTTHAYSDSILHGKAPAISRQEWPEKESI